MICSRRRRIPNGFPDVLAASADLLHVKLRPGADSSPVRPASVAQRLTFAKAVILPKCRLPLLIHSDAGRVQPVLFCLRSAVSSRTA